MPLASIYFPDTEIGKDEAKRLFPTSEDLACASVHFCKEFEAETDPLRFRWARREGACSAMCANRTPRYAEGTNRCRRCPAGFAHEDAAGILPQAEVDPIFVIMEADRRRELRELEAMYA